MSCDLLTQKKIDKADVVLSYYIGGNLEAKECLFFLNGLYHDTDAWIKQIRFPFFKKNFKLIFFDYRGLGGSIVKNYGRNGFKDIAQDIYDVLKKERVLTSTFVAYSVGGIAALYFSSFFGDHLKCLVLLNSGTTVSAHLRRSVAAFLELLEKGYDFYELIPFLYPLNHSHYYLEKMVESDTDIRRKYADYNHDLESLKLLLKPFRNPDHLNEAITRVSAPTLFITAEKDMVFPPFLQRGLIAKIEKCTLNLIPECSHASFIEEYTKVNSCMQDFLQETLL